MRLHHSLPQLRVLCAVLIVAIVVQGLLASLSALHVVSVCDDESSYAAVAEALDQRTAVEHGQHHDSGLHAVLHHAWSFPATGVSFQFWSIPACSVLKLKHECCDQDLTAGLVALPPLRPPIA